MVAEVIILMMLMVEGVQEALQSKLLMYHLYLQSQLLSVVVVLDQLEIHNLVVVLVELRHLDHIVLPLVVHLQQTGESVE